MGVGGGRGAQGFWSPADLATVVPGGGAQEFWSPACLFTLAYFLPPSPQPPSRREGGEYYFISPGATAPGTPATGWDAALAHLKNSVCLRGAVPAAKERGDRGRGTSAFEMVLSPGAGRTSAGGGVQGFWSPADLATVVPGGGAGGAVARLPFYFSLFPAPIPPTPFPAGRGGIKVILCKGLRPLHPRELYPGGTGETMGNRLPSLLRRTAGFPT